MQINEGSISCLCPGTGLAVKNLSWKQSQGPGPQIVLDARTGYSQSPYWKWADVCFIF